MLYFRTHNNGTSVPVFLRWGIIPWTQTTFRLITERNTAWLSTLLWRRNLHGYYQFLQRVDVVDFLCSAEVEYIQNSVQVPHEGNYGDQQRCLQECDGDSSSDTYWPVHSDLDAPDLDLGWPTAEPLCRPHRGSPLLWTRLSMTCLVSRCRPEDSSRMLSRSVLRFLYEGSLEQL